MPMLMETTSLHSSSTFFFRHMKELMSRATSGYICNTTALSRKKGKEERYCWTDEERIAIVKELAGEKKQRKYTQRYKGSW